jgi:hypothetical protein
MGSEETKITKAQAIRNELEADPDAKPKAIAEKLSAQGWDVAPNEVSQVKFYWKKGQKKGQKKRGRKAAPKAAPAAVVTVADDAISLAALQKVKQLAQELGGVDEAKKALSALARLLG